MQIKDIMKPNNEKNFYPFDHKKAVIALVALLGSWIVSIPYGGQVLKTFAIKHGLENSMLFEIPLIVIAVGLLFGSILLKNIKRAKTFLNYSIPICLLCTTTFLLNSYAVWIVSLSVLSFCAGVSINSTSYYLRKYLSVTDRFRFVPVLIILIKLLDMISVLASKYISTHLGTLLLILFLIIAWVLSMKIPVTEKNKTNQFVPNRYNKKNGYKALLLLGLFLIITGINYGIMVEFVSPRFFYLGWLQDVYVYIPYIVAAYVILKLRNRYDRNILLYITISMILAGFALFVLLEDGVMSYLIIYTLMMAAWAIVDVFWWTILVKMLDMDKDPAKIFGVGFGAAMIGNFLGSTISQTDILFSNSKFSIIIIAVICVTLIVLPFLHKHLSLMINRKTISAPIAFDIDTNEIPEEFDNLSERERQISLLLVSGRTYKQIADELFISVNTVKTHIKNLYSVLGVSSKTQLYNLIRNRHNQ